MSDKGYEAAAYGLAKASDQINAIYLIIAMILENGCTKPRYQMVHDRKNPLDKAATAVTHAVFAFNRPRSSLILSETKTRKRTPKPMVIASHDKIQARPNTPLKSRNMRPSQVTSRASRSLNNVRLPFKATNVSQTERQAK